MLSGLNGEQCEVCEVCSMSKLHELPVRKQTQTRAKLKGERVFSDNQGPIEVPSLQGAQYALTFSDDYSRYAVANFVVRKSDTLECFKEYVVRYAEPKALRTDNGGEYTSTAFKNYSKSVGIHQELTVPVTPQQNRVAERFNSFSVEMTRCLLLEGKFGKQSGSVPWQLLFTFATDAQQAVMMNDNHMRFISVTNLH